MAIFNEQPAVNHSTSIHQSEEIANASITKEPQSPQTSKEDVAVKVDPTKAKKPREMNTVTWICVVTSLLSSIFLFALDNTIVADVQPSIIATLGHIEKLPWVSVAYALGGIAVNLFVSKLFWQFNNKYIFIAGVVIFEAGSALCGAAPSMSALIVGRAMCGVGSAGIYIGAMNLLSVLTTEAERPVYLSYVGLTWGLGTVLGPIVGGSLAASSATWRWSFYLNLCVGAVVGPAYVFLLPSYDPRPGLKLLCRLRELDLVGAVLNAGAFASLIMAIVFGGSMYAWASGQIIGLFVCSGVLWTAFICQQAFCFFTTKEHRLFPVDFIKSWEMNILFAQIAAAVVATFIPIYFISLYFQFVRNDSPLEAGVRLLPFVFFQVFGVIFSGVIMGKFGYYMPWYLCGGIFSLIGGALFYTCTVNTSVGSIYGYSILSGLGCGLYVQASYPVAQLKVDPTKIPLVVAFIGCGQITGITLALALSNSIFLNEATNKIADILPQMQRTVVQQAITGIDGGTFFAELGSEDQAQVLNALVDSIDNVYCMVIAAGALTTVLSLFMKRERLFIQPSSPAKADEASKDEERIS